MLQSRFLSLCCVFLCLLKNLYVFHFSHTKPFTDQRFFFYPRVWQNVLSCNGMQRNVLHMQYTYYPAGHKPNSSAVVLKLFSYREELVAFPVDAWYSQGFRTTTIYE